MCKCIELVATTEYVGDNEYYWGVCLGCGRHWYEPFTNTIKQQKDDRAVRCLSYQQWIRVGESDYRKVIGVSSFKHVISGGEEYHNENQD